MGFSQEMLLLGGTIFALLAALMAIQRRRKVLEQRIEAQAGVFKKTFDISDDAILILSDDHKILYANKASKKLFALSEETLYRSLNPVPKIKTKKEWISLDDFIRQVNQSDQGKMQSFPKSYLLLEHISHRSIPVNLYIDRTLMGKPYTQWANIISIHDLTREFECSKAAYRHKLTNLPNQLQAKTDMNKLFSKIHLHNKKLALALIGIDNFPQIKALIGYTQSESIVVRFAQFLEYFAKKNGFDIYHTFSNNFLLCLPVIESEDEVVDIVKQIQKELNSLYEINGVPFYLTASAGIGIYPDSGSTLTLLDHTFKALVEAQKAGYGHIHIYRQAKLKKKYDELELFNAIHEGIKKGEFEVFYQPIVRASDHEVVAAEALARWRHDEQGYIPPDIFIPMLEKSGFIIEMGHHVLTEVLKQQKRWEFFGFKPIEVSINASFLEIESEKFVEHVAKKLKEHQVAPGSIKFEITEGTAMENEEFANSRLRALKKLGVSIALDDFGTGYTSFAYLKRFPAGTLKIDKTMVDRILESEEDQRIVKAMIELGHTLGMKVVVEGVENRAMAEMITSLDCDYLQGYYFGKPLPAYEFQEMIRR